MLLLILDFVYSSQAILIVLATIFCFVSKDTKGTLFCFITFIFFLWAISLNSFIKIYDQDYFIFRYIFWAFNDLAWMGLIAYLTIKDKIHLWQSIIGQLIVLPAPLLQLMRLVDRHYFDLTYTDYLYKGLLPLINTATVVLCFAPLFVVFTQYLKNKKSEAEVEV
ncbi:hypothetical protein KO527_11740 [Pseudoalteromonas sp. C2R02]|uniref:hypothetical protein n=1 Tax=Pseudoalteromonas sp. C2R02 TaxID=2841565 RepID=UPI001C08B8F7|nr:hypothetical protein [Pseudoalteromonas sp. C2R02]MBU2970023.1 hypothetical protein [Pseudoalteromonas sp. C2R02]